VVDFCRELLEDGLPLTQSRMILETMLRAQKYGGKVPDMVDACRLLMKRAITARFTDAEGQVNLVICSPDAENVLRRAAEQTAGARAAPAVGDEVRKLLGQVREVEDKMAEEGRPVALAVPADMRRSTRALLGIQSAQIPVVAFSELEAGSRLRTVLVLTAQMQGFSPQQAARPSPPVAAPPAPGPQLAAARAR
jgi:type III secretion protein V